MQWFNRSVKVGIVAFATMLLSNQVLADRHPDHEDRRAGYVLDSRYHHNQYYPPRGYAINRIPQDAHLVRYGGAPYYFHRGVWYRPYGPRFVVVGAPLGLFLPFLPPFYSTLWVGGTRYYYADDTYYTYDPERRGYVVVEKPADADVREDSSPPAPEGSAATPAATNDFFIYPKNGQNEKQQSSDRYECHRWAADQTHFDPTEPSGAGNKADYRRAISACLEARGYSVK